MKRKIKILAHIAGWLMLLAGLAVTLAFSLTETASVECSDISVTYTGDQTIRLGSQTIIRMARTADNKIIGKKLKDIDCEAIEQEVGKHSTILKADAYTVVVRDSTGYKGILNIKVNHRTPVMRIITGDASYFMDDAGVRFPTSSSYSANVMLVTGNVSENLARNSILPVVLFISGHDFWKAQIKQIHVDRNEELLMTPLVGNQLIEFGNSEDYLKKFRNLMAFYEQVLANSNWDKYERISLKYRNQIIAKKRD